MPVKLHATMGRKQSKKKRRYTFEQIKQFYQQGKYSQAFRALIKTKVAPYQKGQYLQLKVKLIQLLAYQFFVNHKYKAAYTQLLLSFKETAVEGFPLNLEYSQILMGLCQMYLGKFSEAIQLLDKSSLLPETKKFRFYYFLALIYDAKITDKSFDTFLEKHQSELSALSPNRIKYLQIAFHLVAKDFARAGELLDQYSALSHKHQINIHAIQAILGAKLSLSTNESAKIKTLYKALLGLALEQEELQYLSLFPTLSQKVNSSIQKEKHKSLNLFLNTLCIKGEALVKSQFEKAMSLADESIQPYMVYNQLSLLYNETEDDFSLIIYQNILKYDRAFFQIPESVFLYLAAIIRIDEEDFLKPGTFWNHIEQYLLRFKDSLSPKKIEQISWLIFYCIKAGKFEIAEGIFLNRIHGLAKNYPDMLGIKLWRIFESATISKVNKQYDWALDFINHRSIEDSQRVFLTELDGILSYLYPENYSENAFSIFDDYEDIINNSFLSAIERFTEQFDNSFESHQNSRKAFLILDYYHLMASYTLKLLKEDSTFFSHKAIQGFIKTYRKTIHFFEKDRELSLHHKSLKLLESFPQTTSLENALTEKLPTKELEELFRPYIQDGMATLVLNTIFKNINKTH
ncbi:MAG TPA: hypothetical protein ENK52_02220, partial [Saprospiraceae bacterium]|nr:hypothetical protein [Saprospiraceae bacterium]